MNDYALINSLLEDGSEASILKLKMIVDFDDLALLYRVEDFVVCGLGFVDDKNVIPLLKLCPFKIFDNLLKKDYVFRHLKSEKIKEIVDLFLDLYETDLNLPRGWNFNERLQIN